MFSNASNSILTEGAVASVLGVRLGGINYYRGKEVPTPYLGEEKRPIEIPDINRTTKISFLTGAIFAALVIFIKIIC
jgi:adenosylcobinamide-phosphate synthase